MTSAFTDAQKRRVAQWHGEAAKVWFSMTEDDIRRLEHGLTPFQAFVLGWQSARNETLIEQAKHDLH